MFLSSELLWHLVRGGFSIPGWLAHVSAAQRTLSGQVLTAPSHVWPRDPSIPAGFPSLSAPHPMGHLWPSTTPPYIPESVD